MKNRSFPGWVGPLVGAVVGVLIALKAARRSNGGVSVQWIVIGAVLGAAAGGIVWLLDVIRGGKSKDGK